MVHSDNVKSGKGSGKRVFKNSLHEKLLAWKNGTDISAVGEVTGIPENAWCGGGDIVSFPSTLSPAERRIAHQLCLRLDLFHASSGEGENRYVTISKSCDFESFQQTSTIDQTTPTYCMWYDEKSIKPLLKPRFFSLSEIEIKQLQKNLSTLPTSIHENVTVTLDSGFLMDQEIENLSHMSHLNAKWNVGEVGINQSESQFLHQSNTNLNSNLNPNLSNNLNSNLNSNVKSNIKSNFDLDLECEQNMNKPHILVQTLEGLKHTAKALNLCCEIAFDLEMHSYRTYHGITCLIQLSGGGVNYIVGTYVQPL